MERLAYAFDPLRIVVFGSYARGDARPGSDLDLLVVLPTVKDKRRVALDMRHALSGLKVGKDIIVTTPKEIKERGWIIGTVLHRALKEGEIVYEANDSA